MLTASSAGMVGLVLPNEVWARILQMCTPKDALALTNAGSQEMRELGHEYGWRTVWWLNSEECRCTVYFVRAE